MKSTKMRLIQSNFGARMADVLIPFNGQWLALSPEAVHEGLQRGREVMGDPQPENCQKGTPECVYDAEGMEAATQIPATWFLEQARKGKVPHIRAGKYVRFRLNEVLEAFSTGNRPSDRLSFSAQKKTMVQTVTGERYRAATTLNR